MLTLALVFSVLLTVGDTTTLRDQFGRPAGSLNSRGQLGKQFVTDCNGITLGYTEPSGTYDSVGRKVAPFPDAGILLRNSKCPGAKEVYK
jgi:hypothetical protein